MKKKKQIVECVPNFSEGKDLKKIKKIVATFQDKEGVKLLDYERDKDYNRSVVTVIGEPDEVKRAVIEAIGVAIEIIDMRKHKGQHPRMGAVDVIPFIPIKNFTIKEAISLSKEVAKIVSEKYKLPVFLYEKSATFPKRENLSKIRKGEFEGMAEKIRQHEWNPDYGPLEIHPTAGVTAIGARKPLIAYNINLDTNNLEIADKIARCIRHINGGLRYCKAMGVELKERGIVQVSINMTDYTKTPLYRAFELVKIEAKRYGVNVLGSEIVGLSPMEALLNSAGYYLGLENFSLEQILEVRMME
ncbi:MAG: glutamate formimidoyltransferase [Candidatus Caldatribacteriota bacterium]|nr:glutamate formimidoyltransferase [Candidatus Caldatribacteriota bacterium]